MREIHGVADAQRIQTANTNNEKVAVIDGDSLVILDISNATYSAGLSPRRAMFIASALNASARRVELKNKARAKAKKTTTVVTP